MGVIKALYALSFMALELIFRLCHQKPSVLLALFATLLTTSVIPVLTLLYGDAKESPLKQSLLLVLDSFLLLVKIDGQQFVIINNNIYTHTHTHTPQRPHNIHNLNSVNVLQIFHFWNHFWLWSVYKSKKHPMLGVFFLTYSQKCIQYCVVIKWCPLLQCSGLVNWDRYWGRKACSSWVSSLWSMLALTVYSNRNFGAEISQHVAQTSLLSTLTIFFFDH